MIPLPLADRYAWFRGEVFACLAEPAAAEVADLEKAPSEVELQSRWFAGAYGNEFLGENGERIEVIDFGEWNAGPGPDFLHCTVRVDGEKRHGAVELDPDVRDWERHGHGGNLAFNEVILHVFLTRPKEAFFTRTQEHKAVPQVQLTEKMLAVDAVPKLSTARAHLGRCAQPLARMTDTQVASLLEAAAQQRLRCKSTRLHRMVKACGREQAILQALAQAFGYRQNQQPFLLITQRLPLKRLMKLPEMEREALLFGVSGFLEGVAFDELEAQTTRSYLRQLWQDWWRQRAGCERWLSPDQLPVWRLSGSRPGNHPQRRLGALAAVLNVWSVFSQPLLDATRWSQANWREIWLGLEHAYWSRHYTLRAEPAKKALALIGETRVQELLANVVYPLLVPERTRLWAEYLELPAMLDNQKLSTANLRLFGPENPRAGVFKKKLHHQQGLLQLYEDFCLEDDSACADCPFPERLLKWS
jgi:Protein of unknown function (DUF2851)